MRLIIALIVALFCIVQADYANNQRRMPMATNHKINVDVLFAALLVIGLLYLINSAISKKHHAAGISNLGITIQADSAYCGMVPANAAKVATGTHKIADGYQNTAIGYQNTLRPMHRRPIMLKVYDVNDGFCYGQIHSVVAENVAQAERIYRLKYPHATIRTMTLHSEYVQVQGIDDKETADVNHQ